MIKYHSEKTMCEDCASIAQWLERVAVEMSKGKISKRKNVEKKNVERKNVEREKYRKGKMSKTYILKR